MKNYYLISLLLLLVACNNREWNTPLTEAEYHSYMPKDTLRESKGILFTLAERNDNGYTYENNMLKLGRPGEYKYFRLLPVVAFENDTTLIEEQEFFESGEHTEGIWVHAAFKKDFATSEIHFRVDSLPPGYRAGKPLPQAEGIYFYQNKRLNKVSRQQTSEAFKAYAKDGFYFFPNSGTLFKRHSIRELE